MTESLGGGPSDRLWEDLTEKALRLAARAHEGQYRKGSSERVPYVQHVLAVAWILERGGFGSAVVTAGLLHDVVEDTETTIEELRRTFGPEVADLVDACSERKTDERGGKRPWAVRKREALDRLAEAGVEARAVALADKLHNLRSIEVDLARGDPIWDAFNAGREEVLGYYREAAERWGEGDERLERLALACQETLERIEKLEDLRGGTGD